MMTNNNQIDNITNLFNKFKQTHDFKFSVIDTDTIRINFPTKSEYIYIKVIDNEVEIKDENGTQRIDLDLIDDVETFAFSVIMRNTLNRNVNEFMMERNRIDNLIMNRNFEPNLSLNFNDALERRNEFVRRRLNFIDDL